MTTVTVRELLHKQIDILPDDMVQQVADFTLFVMARRKVHMDYADWEGDQWEEFALGQFFRDDDEVVYSLQDAKEIYHP